jgi:phytoene dehydrogenase-like protein
MTHKDEKTILIIGAGFAGLSAGIYAQMNGYRTRMFEMHDKPGGLCTSWTRKGYTIDGCIHWLVGSSPRSASHRIWEEVGIASALQVADLDEYMRFEGADGRTFVLHANVDELERHMLELSPADEKATRDFIRGIRLAAAIEPPGEAEQPLRRLARGLKLAWLFARKMPDMRRWMSTTATELARRFSDPLLSQAIRSMWFPEFSMFFMLFTFAHLHKRNAGYPIGGSMPLSRALEKRYLGLGGTIDYGCRVEKILVEGDAAVGVRLADGTEHRASRVISAADGHTTIFSMLDGRYVDEAVKAPYETWPPFPPLILVGLGVRRSFEGEPKTVNGISFPLAQPVEIAGAIRDRIKVHIHNQDPTLAPAGKTVVSVLIPSTYEYWKELGRDREAYRKKKDEVARTVLEQLEHRFPGLAAQVEMVDVATPLTFERYTGNWKASFEGWIITPRNASTIMRPMKQTLPGLSRFSMCGQWVEPGGGLPTSIASGRRLVQGLCREDGKRFIVSVA